tara:strand:- start:181 stop:882 length:702 start_codon:yes stop_codon:yes gene_type:complete
VHAIQAQVQKEREVVSSGGSEAQNSSLKVSYTVGEPVVTTVQSANTILTQGFEQFLDSSSLISFDVSVQDATCAGKRDGRGFISNINGCQGPYTVNWSAGFNPADTFSTVGLLAGDYSVQVVSSDGCSSQPVTFTIGLIDPNPCLLKFYSGITPNNDGINDSWFIENVELVPDNEVRIFNRLGNLVWEGSNYDNNNTFWDGNNLSGNDLPADTYFYMFESDDGIEKGWIELTR